MFKDEAAFEPQKEKSRASCMDLVKISNSFLGY
jgi:hypothetical protein